MLPLAETIAQKTVPFPEWELWMFSFKYKIKYLCTIIHKHSTHIITLKNLNSCRNTLETETLYA